MVQPYAEDSQRTTILKLLLLATAVGAAGWLYLEHRDAFSLETVARYEQELVDFRREHPVAVFAAAFLIYVLATGLSFPVSMVLTAAFGWFFGFLPGVLLASFASTTGATCAFLMSRYLLRDAVRKHFGDRLRTVDAALHQDGVFYLFLLRLTPFPYFIINLVMGLTPMRVWTFWWVSQVGMLAGTCVAAYAGSTIPSARKLADEGVAGLFTPQLIVAFVLLGLFPFAARKLTARWRDRGME
jgi:uncharacterized membrane protein YdjX (TVP38/TMEM64 family)